MKTWREMSSRERDALVAEQLFGWQERPCDLEETDGELTIYSSGDACCPRCGAYGHINSFEHDMMPPAHYTTSWDAAWQVLQHMAAQFDYKPWNRLINELFGADGEELSPSYRSMASVVKWTPEKVCLAALRSIGYEIKEKEDLVKEEPKLPEERKE